MRNRKAYLKALAMACVLSGGLALGGLKVDAAEVDSNVGTVTDAESTANEAETENAETPGSEVEVEKDGIAINEMNFPDTKFRESINEFDTDKNGYLSESELQNVKRLSLTCYPDDTKVKSIKGIEYFTNLEYLNIGEQKISDVDLSKNTELVELIVNDNQIKNLDISKNVKLKLLWCYNNQLTELDVSNQPDLTSLFCYHNELKSLNLSKNLKLYEICCWDNKLGSLDVSKNTGLSLLDCRSNGIQNLDVTMLPSLKELFISDNLIKELDVSKNTVLQELSCLNNELTTLNLNGNKTLRRLDCENNKLTEIDVSQNTELEWLFCARNNLSNVDVSKNLKLTSLDCSRNHIENLDISKNTQLDALIICYNPLTKIDIHRSPKLVQVAREGHLETKEESFGEYQKYYMYTVDCVGSLVVDPDDVIDVSQFKDLKKGEWYEKAVLDMKDWGYMNGTSETTFEPDSVLTRAQFVTVLHNIAGGKKLAVEEYNEKFGDVPKGEWYTNPVMWALKKGITSGVSENEFGTDTEITREQLATLLYKYAKLEDRKQSESIAPTVLDKFSDKGEVSEWAVEAMRWAVEYQIISGKPGKDGTAMLDPKGKATRAECAQMIFSFSCAG